MVETIYFVVSAGTKGAIIMGTHTAESLFKSYKIMTELSVSQYNKLAESYPGASLPTLARQIWRSGMLAEIWGVIASKLNKQGKNYLAEWREGR
jgi:hypothetical protein